MTKKDLQQKIVDICYESELPIFDVIGILEVIKLLIFETRMEGHRITNEKDNDNS